VLAPAARQLLLIGLLIPFGFILVGPWLFSLVYGGELAAYGWILVALACVLPFRFMSILFGVALTSTDAQTWRTIALAIAVAFALGLEIILIPRIGVMGAIIGVYTVWMLTAALSIAATWRIVGPVLRLIDVVGPVAIGAIGFAAGRLVLMSDSAWAAPVSGIVYAVVVGALLVAWLARSSRWPSARSA
jgi:O-antigen/teichoic acid export membrane protein